MTLRGERMYEFLDRLINIALPRVRDFRGVSTKAFDGRGNYTLGVRDHFIFPEIDYAKVDKSKGMNVTIVTTARTDDEARVLLQQLGMPFRKVEEKRLWPRRAMIIKAQQEAEVHDAQACAAAAICGRPRAYLRKFGLCRICFRQNALARATSRACMKASW